MGDVIVVIAMFMFCVATIVFVIAMNRYGDGG